MTKKVSGFAQGTLFNFDVDVIGNHRLEVAVRSAASCMHAVIDARRVVISITLRRCRLDAAPLVSLGGSAAGFESMISGQRPAEPNLIEAARAARKTLN